jgi:hypothetical protein
MTRGLIGRLRRREDLATGAEDARERDQHPGDPPRVETPGDPDAAIQDDQEPRTPNGSDGVPYHPDDPRFPDVWGAHPRSPFARIIG